MAIRSGHAGFRAALVASPYSRVWRNGVRDAAARAGEGPARAAGHR